MEELDVLAGPSSSVIRCTTEGLERGRLRPERGARSQRAVTCHCDMTREEEKLSRSDGGGLVAQAWAFNGAKLEPNWTTSRNTRCLRSPRPKTWERGGQRVRSLECAWGAWHTHTVRAAAGAVEGELRMLSRDGRGVIFPPGVLHGPNEFSNIKTPDSQTKNCVELR